MKHLVLIVESFFLNNSSGINTFIKNICTLYPNNTIVVTDCEEDISDLKIYKKNNIKMIYSENMCLASYSRDFYKKVIINNISKLDKSLEYVFIANSFMTLEILTLDIFKDFKNYKLSYYTHIGDLLEPTKKDLHDFKSDEIYDLLNILKNNNIEILTQTNCVKERITNLINKNSIVLSEPVYLNGLDIKLTKKDTVLIISSNYKRKRFDLMLKLLSKIDCNIKILCDSINGYYDIYQLLKINNILTKNVVILENVNHSQLKQHIISSKCLLHISDIEVCPYSVLEASIYIPSIINNNSIWSEDFKDISYMIDPNNEDRYKNIMNDILNTDIKTLFNYNEYMKNCKFQWDSYLDILY